MRCFHPLQAFQSADGSVTFSERQGGGGPVRSLWLRCGQCIGCRLDRSAQWACRVMNEASLWPSSAFITLTYRDEDLPKAGVCERCEKEIGPASLHYCDFQLFMKRLRFHFKGRTVRFFMAGEYGSQLGRPHFHACVFNVDFPDKVRCRKTAGGWLFRSPTLEKLWPYGYSSIGEVTFESAAYVARYVCAKVTGDRAAGWYQRTDVESGHIQNIEPEFARMSLKPGLGQDWMRLYWQEVACGGKVVVGGREIRAPKYYERMMKRLAAFEDLEYERAMEAQRNFGEALPERLAVQEVVAKARANLFSRGDL